MDYSKAQLIEALLAGLINIQTDGPHDSDLGICYNLRFAGVPGADDPGVYAIMRDLFLLWPKYSGDSFYPVPYDSMEPVDAYLEIGNVWEGEYGASRKELLAFLIAQLQGQVNEQV